MLDAAGSVLTRGKMTALTEGERQQMAELEERWARLRRTAGEEVPGQESEQVKVCREQPQDTDGRWKRVSQRHPPSGWRGHIFPEMLCQHRFATRVDD